MAPDFLVNKVVNIHYKKNIFGHLNNIINVLNSNIIDI